MAAPLEDEFDSAAPLWTAGPGMTPYRERAQAWLRAEALREVVAAFAGNQAATTILDHLSDADASQFADALKTWSAATLDTRQGYERQTAPHAVFSENQQQSLLSAAELLGLRASRQPVTKDAQAVVLGGTVTANLLRVRLAAFLVDVGIVSEVVVVGGTRPLQPWETELLVTSSAPETARGNEMNHLSWTARQMFGTEPRPGRQCQMHHKTDLDVPLTILEAQPGQSGYRPNTLDCYLTAKRSRPYRRTILITTAIYQPYTFFLLSPHLPKTEETEIIGTRSRFSGDKALSAQLIGQEIHAAIKAATALILNEQQP